MGAYFRCYKKDKFIKKTLIFKKGGSPYPNFIDFNKKLSLLKKYLGNFVINNKVNYDGKRIRVTQPLILGEDIFDFLKRGQKPKALKLFIKALINLYQKTGMLPDLVNKENILITKNNEIKIVDVWPLFFKERIKTKDISNESYYENLQKFALLKKQILRPRPLLR